MLKSIDQISIFLGIVLCVAIAILLFKYIPLIYAKYKPVKKLHNSQKKDLTDTDRLLRNHLLKKVQIQHLAHELCSLSDVYVKQFLYSHPLHANPSMLQEDEPIFFREALSVLDVPELACELPLPKVTLTQALSGGVNIAIAGGIGIGKTTCMANLAAEILEKRCTDSNLNNFLPLYFHIVHLSQYSNLPLLECLSRCLFDDGVDLTPPEIEKALASYQVQSNLLLLIDGLDELRPTEFNAAVKLLQRINQEYPHAKLVTTCGPYFTGSLESAGFCTLPIIPPGQVEFRKALSLWLKVWQRVNPDNQSTQLNVLESDFIQLWTNQEISHPTYADFTFSTLAVLFHDIVKGNQPILPYLQRKTKNKISLDSLVRLSLHFSSNGGYCSSLRDASKSLSSGSGFQPVNSSDSINLLLFSGLLSQHADRIRFSNPSVLVHLLALSESFHPKTEVSILVQSPIEDLVSRYSSAEDAEYIVKWIDTNDPFDVRSLAIILSHLFSKSSMPSSISSTFPKLAKYIISDQLPLSTKLKFAAIINYANSAIFSQLLARLETLPDKDCRRLCSFFYGFLPLTKHESFLINTLDNPQKSVSMFGFLSLLISSDTNALKMLLDVIQSDPERFGRAVSELSSQYPKTGRQVISELSSQENTTLRRFSLYGLRLIVDEWADTLLDEISRNDKAWIIRDAAAQAVNNKHKPETYAPQRLNAITDNPLIVTAASKRGVGIPRNAYPYELLLDLLDNGTFNESVQAMQYLAANPNEAVIAKFKRLNSFDNPMREIASRVLYEISLRN